MKKKIALMCYFQKACYNLADHLLIAWLQVCGTFYWFQETFVVQFCVCSVQLQLLPPSSKVAFPQAILVSQTATSGRDSCSGSGNREKGKAEGPAQTLEGVWAQKTEGKELDHGLEVSLLLHLSHPPGWWWRVFLVSVSLLGEPCGCSWARGDPALPTTDGVTLWAPWGHARGWTQPEPCSGLILGQVWGCSCGFGTCCGCAEPVRNTKPALGAGLCSRLCSLGFGMDLLLPIPLQDTRMDVGQLR